MNEFCKKRYRIYEYIRDNENITGQMSNTKELITKLMSGDRKTRRYCQSKLLEEKNEMKSAMQGKHFHKGMTKREILVNEISQYFYWSTIIAISRKIAYDEFDAQEKVQKILSQIDVSKIGEKEPITLEEITMHDLEEMKQKEYLKEVI